MSEFTTLPIPSVPVGDQAAAVRTAIGVNLSQVGGASMTAQYDSNGNLVTGAFSNDGVLFGNGGNIIIPDVRGIRWMKKNGTLSGFSILPWQDHDANGGELLIQSPFRTALIQPGAFQLGNNASGLRAFFLHLVSGEATASRTIRHSPAISMQTRTYNSGSEVAKHFAWQAVPTDATNETVVVKGFFNASIAQADTNPSAYTAGAGLASGDLGIEITEAGTWHAGANPAFEDLTDGATITLACNKYRSEQFASITLGGNRTLAITGAVEGMRGRLIVRQDATGGRTLTLPPGSLTPNGTAGVIALTSASSAVDMLVWVYDGTNFYWDVRSNLTAAVDADLAAFLSASSITDPTTVSALTNLVTALKSANLWSKFDALYPLCGGTSTSNAQDLKGAYPTTWAGTPTHNSNGVTGNASNAWGNTGVNFSTIGSRRDNCHMYFYSRTTTPTANGHFGGAIDASSFRMGLYPTGAANIGVAGLNFNAVGSQVASASSDFRKHFAVQRINSTTQELYVGSLRLSNALSSTGVCSQPMALLARKTTATADSFSNVNLAFASFGQALTETEWTTFRGIVDTFQAALGRANS